MAASASVAPSAASRRKRRGWRLLGAFWLVLLLAAGTLAGFLQYLGPVAEPGPQLAAAAPAIIIAATPAVVVPAAPGGPVALAAARPNTPIAPPIHELLEDDPAVGGVGLPRVVPGQKPPMQAYAGGYDPMDHRPRIGLLLAGIGLSDPDSEDAIRMLPAAITLAVSPYSARPEPLLEQARTHGHEYVLSIPMEAQGFPMNDEGPHALLTGVTRSDNRERLHWALSRTAGYAGATGALDGMRGERFASSGEQMSQMLDELGARGLYYIDARPGEKMPLPLRGRSVDLVVDEPPVRSELTAKLAQLEQIARDKGQALGLAGMPRPVTVGLIAEWAGQLGAHGLALVPVSALLQPLTAVSAK